MPVPHLLLETLEDLGDGDFKKFKWFLGLKILKGCSQIPRCHLESPHRHDTVSKMIDTYREEMAVSMTVAILKMMKHNDAAEKLKEKHTAGAAAQEEIPCPLVNSSSALALSTHQRSSAVVATGAIAPRAPMAPIALMPQIVTIAQNASSSRVIISGNVGGNVGGNIVGDVWGNRSVIITGNVRGDIGGNVISGSYC